MDKINPDNIIYPVGIIILIYLLTLIPLSSEPICKDPNPIVVERRQEYFPGGFLGMGAHNRNYFICKKCGRRIS